MYTTFNWLQIRLLTTCNYAVMTQCDATRLGGKGKVDCNQLVWTPVSCFPKPVCVFINCSSSFCRSSLWRRSRRLMSGSRAFVCMWDLWRRDNDGSIDVGGAQVLDNRQVFVRGARGRVHDEVIQVAPIHVPQELFDHPWRTNNNCYITRAAIKQNNKVKKFTKHRQTVFLGTPPDDGIIWTAEQKPNGHDRQVVIHVLQHRHN